VETNCNNTQKLAIEIEQARMQHFTVLQFSQGDGTGPSERYGIDQLTASLAKLDY
jgi:hypothetical protein